jgi:hypothetical protein
MYAIGNAFRVQMRYYSQIYRMHIVRGGVRAYRNSQTQGMVLTFNVHGLKDAVRLHVIIVPCSLRKGIIRVYRIYEEYITFPQDTTHVDRATLHFAKDMSINSW